MDSDQGKLFIGGISWETSEDKLKEYFGQYGDVLQAVIMRDKVSGRPRGFGFVVFADPATIDAVLQDKHSIDGRTVEAKRALSREEQQNSSRAGYNNGSRNFGPGGNIRTKKIFVGGLPPTLTEDGFQQYFENYGTVTDVVIMYDQNTERPRGFGFISFDSEDAVDRVLHKTFHDLNGKQVEVKRALPKDANPGMSNRSIGGGASGGGASGASGGFQAYNSSSGNPGAYDGRMDINRYMQSQNTGGAFPHYSSSGYGAPGYGYGAANNSMGYGGYGGANPGYGGPAGAAYGNPNVPNSGYANGPPGATRSSWVTQTPSGYGAVSYGNAGTWGAAGPVGSGPVSGPVGQSPGGGSGYGNQGYGYGGDGSYGSQGGFGNVGRSAGSGQGGNAFGGGAGVEMQGNSGGYMGSGYGDVTGQSGYGSEAWRSDPSQASGNYGTPQASGTHGAQAGYGGGYGGTHTRQAQQQ